jgi:hypothetical protein
MFPPSAAVTSPAVRLPLAMALLVHRKYDIAKTRRRDLPRPSSASIEVRRASWERLWRILLREPSNDDVEQQKAEPSREPAETNRAGARAASGKEGTMAIK